MEPPRPWPGALLWHVEGRYDSSQAQSRAFVTSSSVSRWAWPRGPRTHFAHALIEELCSIPAWQAPRKTMRIVGLRRSGTAWRCLPTIGRWEVSRVSIRFIFGWLRRLGTAWRVCIGLAEFFDGSCVSIRCALVRLRRSGNTTEFPLRADPSPEPSLEFSGETLAPVGTRVLGISGWCEL